MADVATVRALIRHHADFNFAPPAVDQKMSRERVAHILDLYGYPPDILTQERAGSTIAHMADRVTERVKDVVAAPVYDQARFDAVAVGHREWFEQEGLKQVDGLRKGENMLVAKVDGTFVGMLGMRKLGLLDGRRVYEHLKASVLPDFEGKGIFTKLKESAVRLNLEESENPLWLMHSKNPKVILQMQKKFEYKPIKFEDYAQLRGWDLSDSYFEKLKQQWDMEGWQYFIVDFQKQIPPKDAANPVK
jgi:GNAT superfamily N-acetyltransferase